MTRAAVVMILNPPFITPHLLFEPIERAVEGLVGIRADAVRLHGGSRAQVDATVGTEPGPFFGKCHMRLGIALKVL